MEKEIRKNNKKIFFSYEIEIENHWNLLSCSIKNENSKKERVNIKQQWQTKIREQQQQRQRKQVILSSSWSSSSFVYLKRIKVLHAFK